MSVTKWSVTEPQSSLTAYHERRTSRAQHPTGASMDMLGPKRSVTSNGRILASLEWAVRDATAALTSIRC